MSNSNHTKTLLFREVFSAATRPPGARVGGMFVLKRNRVTPFAYQHKHIISHKGSKTQA